jgi:Na+(H+)/acetate symporter ActP
VLIYVFYVFNPPPLLFSPGHAERLRAGENAPAFARLQSAFDDAYEARRSAASDLSAARDAHDGARIEAATSTFLERDGALQSVRRSAADLVRDSTGDRTFTDVNYIIPTFILQHLPIGLIGVLIVAIIMAATDTIAGELNSLSTATVIDFYKRRLRPTGTDAHYLGVSKLATGLWGLFACAVAVWAAELGSLIEVVNRFGSFFYGSILGVFILAIGFPRATGHGAFVGLIAGMGAVAGVAAFTRIAFLWHNVVGAVGVVIVGVVVSEIDRALVSRR